MGGFRCKVHVASCYCVSAHDAALACLAALLGHADGALLLRCWQAPLSGHAAKRTELIRTSVATARRMRSRLLTFPLRPVCFCSDSPLTRDDHGLALGSVAVGGRNTCRVKQRRSFVRSLSHT